MPARTTTCPYRFHLDLAEGDNLLVASIENVSDKLQAIICETHWNSTRLVVQDGKGTAVACNNVYPPVTPSPAAYVFLKPGEKKVVTRAGITRDATAWEFTWARAQHFMLPTGTYHVKAGWMCDYGNGAMFDQHSYE